MVMSMNQKESRGTPPRRTVSRPPYYLQFDYLLLFITLLIVLFGLLMIYSSSSYTASVKFHGDAFHFVKRQFAGVGLGLVCVFFMNMGDYQILFRSKKIMGTRLSLTSLIYLMCLVLQSIVLIPGIGVEHNGARRWLAIAGQEFQPAEITKIAIILFVAQMIYKKPKELNRFMGFVRIMIFVGPLIILIAVENLSTAITAAGIAVGMCFVASRKWNYFLGSIGALGGAGAIYIFAGKGFRAGRISAWKNVETDPHGFQTLQGLYAIASGGLFGCGLGQSMQKLGYIPEAYNDMIFAIICEELGLVGALFVMGMFLFLLWRIMVVACNAPDLHGSLICIGVLIHIGLQVILNIAVVTNTIPNTGVPLPFISYGGTASAIMMAEMGLVLNVSKQIRIKGRG